jgi:streptogramin lyase
MTRPHSGSWEFSRTSQNTLGVLFFDPRCQQPPSTLKAFDLQTGAPKEKYPLPTAGAFCNDMAVGGDGTVYISDTNSMEVDRRAPGSHQLEVWAGNGGFGPKGSLRKG